MLRVAERQPDPWLDLLANTSHQRARQRRALGGGPRHLSPETRGEPATAGPLGPPPPWTHASWPTEMGARAPLPAAGTRASPPPPPGDEGRWPVGRGTWPRGRRAVCQRRWASPRNDFRTRERLRARWWAGRGRWVCVGEGPSEARAGSRRPSGLRKTSPELNSLAHRTTWLRSDFCVRTQGGR